MTSLSWTLLLLLVLSIKERHRAWAGLSAVFLREQTAVKHWINFMTMMCELSSDCCPSLIQYLAFYSVWFIVPTKCLLHVGDLHTLDLPDLTSKTTCPLVVDSTVRDFYLQLRMVLRAFLYLWKSSFIRLLTVPTIICQWQSVDS